MRISEPRRNRYTSRRTFAFVELKAGNKSPLCVLSMSLSAVEVHMASTWVYPHIFLLWYYEQTFFNICPCVPAVSRAHSLVVFVLLERVRA
jgi:hypothetical protein